MNVINDAQQSQSEDSKADDSEAPCDHSSSESYGEGYDNYKRKELVNGYTNYRGTSQIFKGVYDRYDSDYEEEETHAQDEKSNSCNQKKSFCIKG